MAATSQPLSTQVALDILKAGGSAVDAAIAANAMEGVVEPMMVGSSCNKYVSSFRFCLFSLIWYFFIVGCSAQNGVGGDLMAMVWDDAASELVGYNGAGRAPAGQSLADVQAGLASLGAEFLPMRGPLTVTVPGAVRGWCDLSARFGKLPLSTVLAPAIAYATEGFPVSDVIAHYWGTDSPDLSDAGLTSGGAFPAAGDGFKATFLLDDDDGAPGKRPPRAGELFANPDLAATLAVIATQGCDGFYNGSVAAAVAAWAPSVGLKVAASDWAAHTGEWVAPVTATYRANVTVAQLPPNPQGLAALQLLNLLEGFDLQSMGFNSATYLHTLVEAKKLAFADAAM
jgi:gamma-glutamyltranspeptidase/glutathione hydrolase